MTVREKIVVAVQDILYAGGGLRWTDLVNALVDRKVSRGGVLANLKSVLDEFIAKGQVVKIKEKGAPQLYFWRSESRTNEGNQNASSSRTPVLKEEDFYPSFAKYLEYSKDEDNPGLNECSKAVPWGRSHGKKEKWGTPDVVGIYKPDHDTKIKFSPEIVSAEIKMITILSPRSVKHARIFCSRTRCIWLSPSTPPNANALRRSVIFWGWDWFILTPEKIRMFQSMKRRCSRGRTTRTWSM